MSNKAFLLQVTRKIATKNLNKAIVAFKSGQLSADDYSTAKLDYEQSVRRARKEYEAARIV